jgi:hypothetical protein
MRKGIIIQNNKNRKNKNKTGKKRTERKEENKTEIERKEKPTMLPMKLSPRCSIYR